MVRAILFDLGDTLLDFEPLDTRSVFREGASATHGFLRDAGRALPALDRYCSQLFRAVRWAYFWAKLRGREFNALHLLDRYHRRLGVTCDRPTLLELAWLWYQPLLRHVRLEANLPATLAELCRRGMRLGVVSNTFVPGAVIDRHLQRAGLIEFFPVRVYSSEVGYRKPHRRIFEHALRHLDVPARQTLFVGDLVKTDIIGARRMGMRTVLKQPLSFAHTHRVADYVVRRISEIRELIQPQTN